LQKTVILLSLFDFMKSSNIFFLLKHSIHIYFQTTTIYGVLPDAVHYFISYKISDSGSNNL